jgi:hypothetical protein
LLRVSPSRPSLWELREGLNTQLTQSVLSSLAHNWLPMRNTSPGDRMPAMAMCTSHLSLVNPHVTAGGPSTNKEEPLRHCPRLGSPRTKPGPASHKPTVELDSSRLCSLTRLDATLSCTQIIRPDHALPTRALYASRVRICNSLDRTDKPMLP